MVLMVGGFDHTLLDPTKNLLARYTLNHRSGLAILIVLQVACMVPQIFTWSAIWDEPGHLVAGVDHWRSQDFRLYAVNPPLCRLWATLPVVLTQSANWPTLDEQQKSHQRLEWETGARFFDQQPQVALRSLRIARCANLIWPVLGTVLIFLLASRCFGQASATAAAWLWAFCPLVIAHGILLPPDIAAAVMLMAIILAASAWYRVSDASHSLLVGLVVGLGLLVKYTLLACCPILFALSFVAFWNEKRRLKVSQLLKCHLLAGLVMIFTVNAAYGWQGSFMRFGDFEFISETLGGSAGSQVAVGNMFRNHVFGMCPVCLPREFVLGIDVQCRDFEINGFYPYMLGQWKQAGFPLFYVWYYLLKMPVGLFALAIVGFMGIIFGRVHVRERAPLAILTILAVFIFISISSCTTLNWCQRYSLVSMPLLCVLAGASWGAFTTRFPRMFLWSVIATTVAIGIYYAPHSLAYFNGLAGGPANGQYLLHGNGCDWGQDALRVGDWCKQYPERRPLAIATCGYANSLAAYAVKADHVRFEIECSAPFATPLRGAPVTLHGWHIVSMLHLLDPRSPYHPLLYLTPAERIGFTHRVYFIDARMALQLADGSLPPLERGIH